MTKKEVIDLFWEGREEIYFMEATQKYGWQYLSDGDLKELDRESDEYELIRQGIQDNVNSKELNENAFMKIMLAAKKAFDMPYFKEKFMIINFVINLLIAIKGYDLAGDYAFEAAKEHKNSRERDYWIKVSGLVHGEGNYIWSAGNKFHLQQVTEEMIPRIDSLVDKMNRIRSIENKTKFIGVSRHFQLPKPKLTAVDMVSA